VQQTHVDPIVRVKPMELKKDAVLASDRTARPARWDAWRDLPVSQRQRLGGYAIYIMLSTLLFLQPIVDLMRHAAQSPLHSHIPLMPLVVAYLLYIRRVQGPACKTSTGGAAVLAAVAVGAWVCALWLRGTLSVNDDLALMTLSFVSLAVAGGFLLLGTPWMTHAAFPLSFLIFMIPMPDGMANALEMASVVASADVSAALFRLTGTPILRDATVFGLPGIVIEVAKECSGIRSSWVLFITSLLASQLFLSGPWRRVVLVAFVIPLGIVRNGFRILVIGLLCVHVGPHMIDSPIHHRGGPLFFALSLGPLFLCLCWLRRKDQQTP
jgi:exosortase C (VPDSG-CTERM-specific)